MKTLSLFAAAAGALLVAGPVCAREFDPAANFVAGRAMSICSVSLGLMTSRQAAKWEYESALRDGLTHHQYATFNEASDRADWIGQWVDALIDDAGGCSRMFRRALTDRPTPEPAQLPAPAYLF